jgi:hypothetical protein
MSEMANIEMVIGYRIISSLILKPHLGIFKFFFGMVN